MNIYRAKLEDLATAEALLHAIALVPGKLDGVYSRRIIQAASCTLGAALEAT